MGPLFLVLRQVGVGTQSFFFLKKKLKKKEKETKPFKSLSLSLTLVSGRACVGKPSLFGWCSKHKCKSKVTAGLRLVEITAESESGFRNLFLSLSRCADARGPRSRVLTSSMCSSALSVPPALFTVQRWAHHVGVFVFLWDSRVSPRPVLYQATSCTRLPPLPWLLQRAAHWPSRVTTHSSVLYQRAEFLIQSFH